MTSYHFLDNTNQAHFERYFLWQRQKTLFLYNYTAIVSKSFTALISSLQNVSSNANTKIIWIIYSTLLSILQEICQKSFRPLHNSNAFHYTQTYWINVPIQDYNISYSIFKHILSYPVQLQKKFYIFVLFSRVNRYDVRAKVSLLNLALGWKSIHFGDKE